MASIQMHFELSQWQEAFTTYKENVAIGNDIVMILSANPHTLGYWVESKPDEFHLPKSDRMYVGDEVLALEERVKIAIRQGRPNSLII